VRRPLSLAVLTVSLFLAGCGGSKGESSSNSTVEADSPTSTSRGAGSTGSFTGGSTSASSDGNSREVQKRLITLEDMPGSGWTVNDDLTQDDDGTTSSDDCGGDGPTNKMDEMPHAKAGFAQSAIGPFVMVAVAVYPSQAERDKGMNEFETAMKDCAAKGPIPDESDPGAKTSFSTLKTPDIPGASKTFGMRLQSEGGTTPVQGDVVAWSGKGNAVAVVLHIGVGAVDPTTTEKIVVAQGKKLG
jgi:hypothetical protein